jgi:hypothetical protein
MRNVKAIRCSFGRSVTPRIPSDPGTAAGVHRRRHAEQQVRHQRRRPLKPVYCDGLLLWELRPRSLGKPISYDGRFFVRIGPATRELEADDFLATVVPAFK